MPAHLTIGRMLMLAWMSAGHPILGQELQNTGLAAFPVPANSPSGMPFDWKPRWRERSDCGRNGLYYYLKLLGNPVTFDELASHMNIDPARGSSLAEIVAAGKLFGEDLEVLWINPDKLHQIAPPYLLHSEARLENESGHLLVVLCEKQQDVMVVLDPVDERLSEASMSGLMQNFSGYVIRQRPGIAWDVVASLLLSSGVVAMLLRDRHLARHNDVATPKRQESEM